MVQIIWQIETRQQLRFENMQNLLEKNYTLGISRVAVIAVLYNAFYLSGFRVQSANQYTMEPVYYTIEPA